MLKQENLRKADVYSGAAIFLFGLWVVLQALKMPMKDSWGCLLYTSDAADDRRGVVL